MSRIRISNGNGGWTDVNTSQQDKQNYEQQHPNSQANAQQDKQTGALLWRLLVAESRL